MLNYPLLRVLKANIASKFVKNIKLEDESSLTFRAGIFDIDPFIEINNGRYLTLADVGRFNHGFRTGFYKKARSENLYFTVVGVSAKYRYRIPFGKKFTMTTKIIHSDEKWIYYLTDFSHDNRVSTSLLARTGVLRAGKLVRPNEVEEIFQMKLTKYQVPQWVELWIKSDLKRPGFEKS